MRSYPVDAKTRYAGPIARVPPGSKFLAAEPVFRTRLLKSEQPAVDRGKKLGLAPGNPVGRRRRRQIANPDRAQRSGNRCRPGRIIEHCELSIRSCAPRLKAAPIRLTKACLVAAFATRCWSQLRKERGRRCEGPGRYLSKRRHGSGRDPIDRTALSPGLYSAAKTRCASRRRKPVQCVPNAAFPIADMDWRARWPQLSTMTPIA